MPGSEFRVVTRVGSNMEPFEHVCPDEEYARSYAQADRDEYPHAEVWVERREVTPWERLP